MGKRIIGYGRELKMNEDKSKGLMLRERNIKYKGHRVKVYEDVLESPDGETLYYDFVENRNGAGVLLVDEEGKLIFVKQYRNSINDFDIEIPAGCAELADYHNENRNPEEFTRADFESVDNPFYQCAMREAEEETGLIPERLIFVNYIIASVGLFSERTAVYIGEGIKSGVINRDSDEFIEIVKLTPEEAEECIHSGQINDSKTIIAILAYSRLKSKK